MVAYLCRAMNQTRDVWALLETNWDHFYWLTGETPHTMLILVEAMRNRVPRRRFGRPQVLDFRNQVNKRMLLTNFAFGL